MRFNNLRDLALQAPVTIDRWSLLNLVDAGASDYFGPERTGVHKAREQHDYPNIGHADVEAAVQNLVSRVLGSVTPPLKTRIAGRIWCRVELAGVAR